MAWGYGIILRGIRVIPRFNFWREFRCGQGPFSQIGQYLRGGVCHWSEFAKTGIFSSGGMARRPPVFSDACICLRGRLMGPPAQSQDSSYNFLQTLSFFRDLFYKRLMYPGKTRASLARRKKYPLCRLEFQRPAHLNSGVYKPKYPRLLEKGVIISFYFNGPELFRKWKKIERKPKSNPTLVPKLV